jgi:hypothetical protein
MMNVRQLAQIVASVALAGSLASCANEPEPQDALPTTTEPATPDSETPSEVLSATAWETTGAKDAEGADVPLTDARVKDFVGYAYFDDDGTFEMYNLDDSPKLQGDWTVSDDGKTRTIVAKDETGKELFTRDVDIRTLTDEEFTYRVYPAENDKTVYFDIVHTPTDHEEPESADDAEDGMDDHDMDGEMGDMGDMGAETP